MRATELLGRRVTLAIRARPAPLGEATTTRSTARALTTARTGAVIVVIAGKKKIAF